MKEKAAENGFTSGANQSETHLVTLLAKHPHLRSLFSQLITPDLEAQLEKVHSSLSSQISAQQPRSPALGIQFADLKRRAPLGLTVDLESEVIGLPDESAFPLYRGNMFGIGDNDDYWWDKALYIRDTALIRELGFVVKNTSPTSAQNVRAEITVGKVDGARVLRTSSCPGKPKASTLGGLAFDLSRMVTINSKSVDVDEYDDRWLITAEFGTVQPRTDMFSDYTFLIGSLKPCSMRLEAMVRADNLPDPVTTILVINISMKARSLTAKEVIDYRLGDDE